MKRLITIVIALGLVSVAWSAMAQPDYQEELEQGIDFQGDEPIGRPGVDVQKPIVIDEERLEKIREIIKHKEELRTKDDPRRVNIIGSPQDDIIFQVRKEITDAEKAGVISFIRDHIFIRLSAKIQSGYSGESSIGLSITDTAPDPVESICIDEKASDGVTFVLDSKLLALDRNQDHHLNFSIQSTCQGLVSIYESKPYFWSYVLNAEPVDQALITREMTASICGTIGSPCELKIKRNLSFPEMAPMKTMEFPEQFELH